MAISLNRFPWFSRSSISICWALVQGPVFCGLPPTCQFRPRPLKEPVTSDVLAGGGNLVHLLARCLSSPHQKHLPSILRASTCLSVNWGRPLVPVRITSIAGLVFCASMSIAFGSHLGPLPGHLWVIPSFW